MHLEIIYGPMFSGKTTTLYQKITQYLDVKKLQTGKEPKAVIINHSSDIRGKFSGNLSSHGTALKKSSAETFFSASGKQSFKSPKWFSQNILLLPIWFS